MTYANILVETHGAVGLIRLNRPQALNALSAALMEDLNAALEAFKFDLAIGAIVVTGSEKAFAAGADIKEMQDKTFAEAFVGDFISRWENVAKARKPIIAAVAGFALGGGCEVAMMCDFILAADTAKFGQPQSSLASSRARGNPAADARGRQSEGDGDDPDRADDGCDRGRALRPRLPHRAGGAVIEEASRSPH